jgi:hypothetical protein
MSYNVEALDALNRKLGSESVAETHVYNTADARDPGFCHS